MKFFKIIILSVSLVIFPLSFIFSDSWYDFLHYETAVVLVGETTPIPAIDFNANISEYVGDSLSNDNLQFKLAAEGGGRFYPFGESFGIDTAEISLRFGGDLFFYREIDIDEISDIIDEESPALLKDPTPLIMEIDFDTTYNTEDNFTYNDIASGIVLSLSTSYLNEFLQPVLSILHDENNGPSRLDIELRYGFTYLSTRPIMDEETSLFLTHGLYGIVQWAVGLFDANRISAEYHTAFLFPNSATIQSNWINYLTLAYYTVIAEQANATTNLLFSYSFGTLSVLQGNLQELGIGISIEY